MSRLMEIKYLEIRGKKIAHLVDQAAIKTFQRTPVCSTVPRQLIELRANSKNLTPRKRRETSRTARNYLP